jgi:hypothetical protein
LTHIHSIVLVYGDGSGYDLTKITDAYLQGITTQNLTFYFHPCGDTTTLPTFPDGTTDTCRAGYSLCMYNKAENKTVVLGKEGEMNFKKDGNTMRMIFIRNPEAPPKELKESSVSLECTTNSDVSVLYAPQDLKIDQVVSIYCNMKRRTKLSIFFVLEFIHVQSPRVFYSSRRDSHARLLLHSLHHPSNSFVRVSLHWNSC